MLSFASLRPKFAALAVAAGLLAGVGALPARAEMSAAQRSDIEAVVHDYLIKHPEVLREALTALDQKEKAEAASKQASAVSSHKAEIFNSPHQAVVGNPNGKVTLVEFFDYNCAYCKKTLPDLVRLTKENPDLRIVLKDFPILTPGSVEAAQIAIALRSQFKGNKYWEFYQRLLGTRGPVAKAQALAVAKDMGADMAKLGRDANGPEVHASLQEVAQLADALQLTGTPSFVLGDDVIVGAVGFDQLKAQIGNVEKCGKTACS